MPITSHHTWRFAKVEGGWTLLPAPDARDVRPMSGERLAHWVVAHRAQGHGLDDDPRGQDQLRQTLVSALTSRVTVGTRVTVTRETSGLLLVETMDPAGLALLEPGTDEEALLRREGSGAPPRSRGPGGWAAFRPGR